MFAVYSFWSGQRDSNPRPPAPKAGALARLRYAPIPNEVRKHILFSLSVNLHFTNEMRDLRHSNVLTSLLTCTSERNGYDCRDTLAVVPGELHID